jgi:hypothetical protein
MRWGVAPGRRRVKYVFHYEGGGIGKAGTSTLLVDRNQVATGKMARTPCCGVGIEDLKA